MKNLSIGILLTSILGIIFYAVTRPKKLTDIEVDNDLLSDGVLSNPNQVEPSSSKVSVKSDEPWVARVNSKYILTNKGSEIFESPAASVEKYINDIYANQKWYDDILKKYNSLSTRKRKKTSMIAQILDSAIWMAKEGEQKYIRYSIF